MEKLKKKKFALILLAGGKGIRFGSKTPKQYIFYKKKPVIFHSLDLFLSLDFFHQYIIVCHPSYQKIFNKYSNLIFALPGERRQDSLFNGMKKISKKIDFICIHDAARPFIKKQQVKKLLLATKKNEAIALGVRVTNTIKQCTEKKFVEKTLDRKNLWETQTPQIISHKLLKKALLFAKKNLYTVTDDLSLIEKIGHKTRIIQGCYSNKKITTAKDLL